jgi:hypothetical protein
MQPSPSVDPPLLSGSWSPPPCGMQPLPPLLCVVVVGVECVCVGVGAGVECVVVGVGAGAECVVVGAGVECVVVTADCVAVVIGVELVVAVVWVAWCALALALWCAAFLGVVAVVGVVGVVAGLAAVVVVDDDAPQPAATRASDAAVTHRIGSRFIFILAFQDAHSAIPFPDRPRK